MDPELDPEMETWPDLIGDLLPRCTFPPAGSALACAVSGGPDSMALLVLASATGCVVTAYHVDHGLRPESTAEAAVVAEAADLFGAAFVDHYSATRDWEEREFRKAITDWELERYMEII